MKNLKINSKAMKTLACIFLIWLIAIILKMTVFSNIETFVEHHNTRTKTREIEMDFDGSPVSTDPIDPGDDPSTGPIGDPVSTDPIDPGDDPSTGPIGDPVGIYALTNEDSIEDSGNIYKLDGDKWEDVDTGTLTNISSNSTHLWGINKAKRVWRCKKPCSGSDSWKHVTGLELNDIGVNDKYAFGLTDKVTESSNFRKCKLEDDCTEKNNWKTYGGINYELNKLAVNGTDVWGIDSSNLFKCESPNCDGEDARPRPTLVNREGAKKNLTDISANDKDVWGVDEDNKIYKYNIANNDEWTPVQGGLKQISANNQSIYGVNSGGEGWKCNADDCDWGKALSKPNEKDFTFISAK